jgi:hypothetical protein
MSRALYYAESINLNLILIRDLNGPKSVTNDAEGVIKDISPPKDCRVFYVDSDGMVDELKHDGAGNFVAFHYGFTCEEEFRTYFAAKTLKRDGLNIKHADLARFLSRLYLSAPHMRGSKVGSFETYWLQQDKEFLQRFVDELNDETFALFKKFLQEGKSLTDKEFQNLLQ